MGHNRRSVVWDEAAMTEVPMDLDLLLRWRYEAIQRAERDLAHRRDEIYRFVRGTASKDSVRGGCAQGRTPRLSLYHSTITTPEPLLPLR